MRQISVILDDKTEDALTMLLEENTATISDIVNAAVLAFSWEKQPVFVLEDNTYNKIISLLRDKNRTVGEWCIQRNISIERLKYLCKRIDNGHAIWGFGNAVHKSRDKESGMIYKTHTAWIAQCMKDDLGLDFI